ncbi:MAG: metal ABC transporter substrate-binding protein [Acidimicrobiales bacterium]
MQRPGLPPTLRWIGLAICLMLAASSAGGCSKGSPPERPEGRRIDIAPPGPTVSTQKPRSGRVLQVVATTSVVADWLRVIGSTNVRTHVVVKAGLDPISYLATPVDVGALQRADLVVAVGRGLEPWLEPARKAAGSTKPVVALGEGLPERSTRSGAPDPYLWLDLENARKMVAALTTALVAADPADEAAFNVARDAYTASLEKADEELRRLLAPVAGKGLVTAKETFGWFASRYGLEVVGSVVPSIDARADIPPQHSAELRQAIQAKQVKAIFAEKSVPEASVRVLAQDAGVKAVLGSGALLGDGLGQAGTDTDTFLGAANHNARSVAANLA